LAYIELKAHLGLKRDKKSNQTQDHFPRKCKKQTFFTELKLNIHSSSKRTNEVLSVTYNLSAK